MKCSDMTNCNPKATHREKGSLFCCAHCVFNNKPTRLCLCRETRPDHTCSHQHHTYSRWHTFTFSHCSIMPSWSGVLYWWINVCSDWSALRRNWRLFWCVWWSCCSLWLVMIFDQISVIYYQYWDLPENDSHLDSHRTFQEFQTGKVLIDRPVFWSIVTACDGQFVLRGPSGSFSSSKSETYNSSSFCRWIIRSGTKTQQFWGHWALAAVVRPSYEL